MHKIKMLTRSVRTKRNISKVAMDKIIEDDSKQTMDWLLQEYDRRDKELLEYEKLSVTMIPFVVAIISLLINAAPLTGVEKLEFAYYGFCTLLLVFYMPFMKKINTLKIRLSILEGTLTEIAQKNIWNYHTEIPINNTFFNILRNKYFLLFLVACIALIAHYNLFQENTQHVVLGLVSLSIVSIMAQFIRPQNSKT